MICESCDHGYRLNTTPCPWCGASPVLAHVADNTETCDTECSPNYWLCRLDGGPTGPARWFELAPYVPLDIHGLRIALSRSRIITFNGIRYDMPMIALALAGLDNQYLKIANDLLIKNNMQSWDVLREFNVEPIDWIDHIDLFDVVPGKDSLKMYGGKMHSRRLQDLPYDPDMLLHWGQRVLTRDYCGNDLRTTRDLLDMFPAQLALREQMGAEYGIDLRSKSDAQIAEAVMKSLLPFKVERPPVRVGAQFFYQVSAWIRYQTPYMADVLRRVATSPLTINQSGGVSPAWDNHLVDWGDKQVRLDAHGHWINRPEGWQHELVRIGATEYAIGIGGLHSTESKIARRADTTHSLSDHDVASYYPSLILRTGTFPPQIGEAFFSIYQSWYERRLAAKAAGDKKNANSLKTLLNGTFGKLNSIWSIFYYPEGLIAVTITGQLALLMLIEMLELSGIGVVSANTDGIVINCRRDMEWLRDSIIAWWQSETGFETEQADYALLASRDVNSYVAIKTDGTVKLKGAFAPAEPGASGWPNPTGQICVDAVVAWLKAGTPIEHTIRACSDVRQFVYVRQVRGGGSYCPNGSLPARTTQTAMRAVVGGADVAHMPKDALLAAYEQARARNAAEREYLGKAVRWYYAAGSRGCIVTPQGGLVSRTDGCRPLMELPDELPGDIDYEWYCVEAQSLLADLGVM